MQKRKAEKSKSKDNAKEERPKKVTKKDDRLKEEKRKEKDVSGKTTAEKLGMQKSIDQIWLVEENKQPKCHNIGKAICTYRKFSQI